MKDLSIIIVSFNTKELLQKCITSIIKTTKGISFEIIVVDNASTDGSPESLGDFQLTLIKNKKNLGFAKANNQGIEIARGKYILLLNSDTLISNNFLKGMLRWMDKHPKVGIASCALLNKDGSLQGTGGYFPNLLSVFSWMTIQDIPLIDQFIKPFHPMHEKSFYKNIRFYKRKKELDWVTGAFFLVRRKVIDDIGLLDEDYFMYVEEVDFCFRAKKAGWQVWYLPQWSIVHYERESATSEFALLSEYQGLKLFYKKHKSSWQYPVLRFLLKLGAFGRIVLFAILEGRDSAKIYAKAFKQA